MSLASWHRYPRFSWLVVVGILVSLDQSTKSYFAYSIPLGGTIEVTAWFNLVHALNEGAAFSLFADADGWQRPLLITVSLLVVIPVAVLCLSRHIGPLERWIGAAVVSGGTGNLIDRIQTGAVVDFLDVHWYRLHWPAFNLADVYIVFAMFCWIALSMQLARHKPEVEQ